MPARQRWVCFDVGEVLIDETRIWSTWADVLGVPRFTLMGVIGGLVARGADHEEAFGLLGFDEWRRHQPDVRAAYGGFQPVDLYPDALPALASLRGLGYRIAVIANQPASRHAELEALGVTADVMAMSEALGVEKPAPAFFNAVLRLTTADADDVLYVGDRVDNDVVPARDAGLRVARVRRGPWGVLQTDDAALATLEVASLRDLVERIDAAWVDAPSTRGAR